MNPARRTVDGAGVAVQISGPQLRPLAVFQEGIKQQRQLLAVNRAPFLEQDHGFVVGGGYALFGSVQHGKLLRIVQPVAQRFGAGVRTDVHPTGDGVDLFPQSCYVFIAQALLRFHQRTVHEDTVVLHHADVHRCRRFQMFHDPLVPGQILPEPVVESVVEPQRVIGVGAGVAGGLPLGGIHLIKMPAVGDRGEAGHVRHEQLGGQQLETAFMERAIPHWRARGQLRRCDGVVAGLLDHDAQRVEEHGLECQVVADLDALRVHQDALRQQLHQRGHIFHVPASAMRNGNIEGVALMDGEADADDVRLVSVQRRAVFITIAVVRRGLDVERHRLVAGQRCVDLASVGNGPIVHVVLLPGSPGGRLPSRPGFRQHQVSFSMISPVSGSTWTKGLSSSATRAAVPRCPE